MKKSSMRQKSRDELEAIISESEELIARTEKEIAWAREIVASKANETSLKNGIYYAKAKGVPEVLLVEVLGYKAVRYVDPSVFGYEGIEEYNFTRRINVRIVKNRFVISHDGKEWELSLLVSSTLNIRLSQVPVLSEYDRLPIVKRWVKLLDTAPELKLLFNELLGRMNEYYGLGMGEMVDAGSDIFRFTEVEYYRAFIEKSIKEDNKLLRNRLLAVRNVLYMIRVYDYRRDVGNTRRVVESKIKWYDKKLAERNVEEFSL